VVIDDCDVPEALISTCWVKISDTENYEDALNEIVNVIFGLSERPPIGDAPLHASTSVADYLPDLTKQDNLAFQSLCRQYLENDTRSFRPEQVTSEIESLGLSGNEIRESLDVLEGRNYIKATRVRSGQIVAVALGHAAVDSYLRLELDDYTEVAYAILSAIVNHGIRSKVEMAEKCEMDIGLVDQMLGSLDDRGLIELVKVRSGNYAIGWVSPELIRMLQ
jgi:hypothetical protein